MGVREWDALLSKWESNRACYYKVHALGHVLLGTGLSCLSCRWLNLSLGGLRPFCRVRQLCPYLHIKSRQFRAPASFMLAVKEFELTHQFCLLIQIFQNGFPYHFEQRSMSRLVCRGIWAWQGRGLLPWCRHHVVLMVARPWALQPNTVSPSSQGLMDRKLHSLWFAPF